MYSIHQKLNWPFKCRNVKICAKVHLSLNMAFKATLRCEIGHMPLKKLMKDTARTNCSPSSNARPTGTVFLETQTQQSADMFTFQAFWPATVI